jgi:transposase-like protein
VVYGARARAAHRKSVDAICRRFGVKYQNITNWRKVLVRVNVSGG